MYNIVERLFTDCWFRVTSKPTRFMEWGKQNESHIFKSLSHWKSVITQGSVGLLQSKKLPYMAATPDKIIELRAVGNEQTELASVVAKSHFGGDHLSMQEDF